MCRAGRFALFLIFFLTGPAMTLALAESRIALVVGNADYLNVPSLANPAGDASLMASTLKKLGFKLVGDGAQINLDKKAFDSAVRSFGSQLQGADVGLFYYAGHGLQVRGANYLVPVGANPTREADVDFELEDVTLVLRQMEAAGTRLNLVMLDACRNNPFGGRGLRAIDAGLAQMRAPEGTLVSFATQPGNIAQDGDDGHSPYTRALAQTIQRPGLGVFDALNQVGLTVKKATGGTQQPWVSSSPIDGSFYFAGAETVSDTAGKLPSKLDSPAIPRRAETSNAVPAVQDDAVKERPRDSKITEVAMVSPVQTAPVAPSEHGGKTDRGVAIYNGRWTVIATGACPHPSRGYLTINDGVITGSTFGGGGSGRISAAGSVSGQFEVVGIFQGRMTGSMTSGTSGSGNWRNNVGCTGHWTMSKS
jgi:Caspase domain